MDINDFGIEQEYFGFGDNYRQLPKSNTSFLNFSVEQTPEYQTALRRHQSTMEDLTSDADKKAEVERFEKEVRQLRVARGGQAVTTGLQTFSNILSQLGYKAPTTASTTQVNTNQSGQNVPQKKFPWALVIGGVVVLGGVVFAIYKFRK
jgi:hypothetical protein